MKEEIEIFAGMFRRGKILLFYTLLLHSLSKFSLLGFNWNKIIFILRLYFGRYKVIFLLCQGECNVNRYLFKMCLKEEKCSICVILPHNYCRKMWQVTCGWNFFLFPELWMHIKTSILWISQIFLLCKWTTLIYKSHKILYDFMQ